MAQATPANAPQPGQVRVVVFLSFDDPGGKLRGAGESRQLALDMPQEKIADLLRLVGECLSQAGQAAQVG